MGEAKIAVALQGITKRFPGVIANDQVDLELLEGEIHTLLGENGAGKSTLMNVLTGIYRPDGGTISIWGRATLLKSPRDAIDQGIGMVHQSFKLVPTHTVTENIVLGLGSGLATVGLDEAETKVAELSQRYGVKVDPAAYVWQLSIGEQQRVEILKILFRGAKILLLDEPTAVLTPQESDELFQTLRSMREEGHSIVFISHKLDEVMAISDRVTVLRGGKNVGTVLVKDTNPQALSNLMVGREIKFATFPRKEKLGAKVLEVERVHALNSRGLPALKGVTFSVAAGEILGFAGVAGNGQQELAQVVTGLLEPTAGSIRFNGADMKDESARGFIDAGVSYVPADRHGVATVGGMSLSHNSVLRRYREPKFGKGPFLNLAAAVGYARRLIQEFNISTPGPDTPVRSLSGGNLQKVILAREMTTRHELLVVMSATRGLDVGATEFVRERLNEHRHKGGAIVLISEDLQELLSLADRIAVLFHGEIMGIVDARKAQIASLGLMMAGQVQA
ncbi:MAG: ABC transporter ATP-binding protein, partial [Acidobacteria bacterium]|nr:ABC transporter ATP-binding protein [Acidobacteriota bacterium]